MRSWTLILAAIVALTALSLASPLFATAKAGTGGLDPATQRYIAVLKPNLTALAKASSAEHIPCYHVGPATAKCQRLHTALGAATKKTINALSKVAVPRKLLSADKELKAALAAYLARINADIKASAARDYKKFRGTHDTPVVRRLNNAITGIIRLVPGTYLPLVS